MLLFSCFSHFHSRFLTFDFLPLLFSPTHPMFTLLNLLLLFCLCNAHPQIRPFESSFALRQPHTSNGSISLWQLDNTFNCIDPLWSIISLQLKKKKMENMKGGHELGFVIEVWHLKLSTCLCTRNKILEIKKPNPCGVWNMIFFYWIS